MVGRLVSVTIFGRHDGDVIFDDDNGPAVVPLAELDDLHRRAARTGYATFDGRRFDRDAIREVRKDWRRGRLYSLDTCTYDGCDAAAPFNLRDTRPRCALHAKED